MLRRSLFLCALLAGCASPEPTTPQEAGVPQPSASSTAPNIVFILTDDQDAASTWAMPNLNSLIAAQGVTFTKFYYTQSLCCPSRTSMHRGQYPHNHKVSSNFWPLGGWKKANTQGLESSTIATWLQAAGYVTSYIGKYLNEYNLAPSGYIPPGWNDWHAVYSADGLNKIFYNYTLNENGTNIFYGSGAANYANDVFKTKAVQFINAQASATQPFFLWVGTRALDIPAPRHGLLFQTTPLPQPPNFNEADVSDKPLWVRNNLLLTAADITTLTTRYRKRLQSLQAIDEMIAAIVTALTTTGQIANTYIVYASDNGYHLGQHRLKADRNSSFEEDLLGPLVVRGPGVQAGLVLDHLVLNTDLAPTFAEIGAAVLPSFVDGRSLLALLGGAPPGSWRQQFGVDWDVEPQPPTAKIPSKFFALRTLQYTYVEYVAGERELYDNLVDPFQLVSLHATANPLLLAALSAQLAVVKACAGLTCRMAEDTPVP